MVNWKKSPLLMVAAAGSLAVGAAVLLLGKSKTAAAPAANPAAAAWELARKPLMPGQPTLPAWSQLEELDRFRLTEAWQQGNAAFTNTVATLRSKYTSGASLLYK